MRSICNIQPQDNNNRVRCFSGYGHDELPIYIKRPLSDGKKKEIPVKQIKYNNADEFLPAYEEIKITSNINEDSKNYTKLKCHMENLLINRKMIALKDSFENPQSMEKENRIQPQSQYLLGEIDQIGRFNIKCERGLIKSIKNSDASQKLIEAYNTALDILQKISTEEYKRTRNIHSYALKMLRINLLKETKQDVSYNQFNYPSFLL